MHEDEETEKGVGLPLTGLDMVKDETPKEKNMRKRDSGYITRVQR